MSENVGLLTSVSVFFYFSFVGTIDKSSGQNNYCKINWRKNAITALLAQLDNIMGNRKHGANISYNQSKMYLHISAFIAHDL